MSGAGLLTWDEAPEADFDYFSVYGGASETFDDLAALLGNTTAPAFDAEGETYAHYFVTATDFSGNEGAAAGIETAVGVPGGSDLPSRRLLLPAHPNPFRRTSIIEFELPAAEEVDLRIYDVHGRAVATLVKGIRPAGRHAVPWEGRDDLGRAAPGGFYFFRLEAGAFATTRSLVLLR
jgi:hypothetical protein